MITIPEKLKKLMVAFQGSFINHNSELILEPHYNIYFRLDNVETESELDFKVIEYVSRYCCKGLPPKKQNEMLEKYNEYLGTSFTKDEVMDIYTHLGNGVNRSLCVAFFVHDYDINILRNYKRKNIK